MRTATVGSQYCLGATAGFLHSILCAWPDLEISLRTGKPGTPDPLGCDTNPKCRYDTNDPTDGRPKPVRPVCYSPPIPTHCQLGFWSPNPSGTKREFMERIQVRRFERPHENCTDQLDQDGISRLDRMMAGAPPPLLRSSRRDIFFAPQRASLSHAKRAIAAIDLSSGPTKLVML